MDLEVRQPKKGEGVPREPRGGRRVPDLARTLAAVLDPPQVDGLLRAVEERGFYDAGLTAQQALLEELVLAACRGPAQAAAVLAALAASDREQERGLVPGIAYRLYHADLPACLDALRAAGRLAGAWPQEAAQGRLKRLMMEHGVAPVLARVHGWAADPDPAVRRLLIEALRPLGVWTGHLQELRRDPAPLQPVLARVLDDPSPYVRTAAANNLNDISKDHPDLVCAWCAAWLSGAAAASAARQWVIRHGLRTLIKRGHPGAQALLGLAPADSLEVAWTGPWPEQVPLNAVIPLAARVHNRGPAAAAVRLQAVVEEPGRGGRRRRRAYLVGRATVAPGATVTVAGRIHFGERNASPRLPGMYQVTLQANGGPVGTRSFAYAGADPPLKQE